jgi:L-ascorbate metabolism protein UlaG (beta-lactamase superfamily)
VTTDPIRVTWWGHATSTITLGGVRVLTDPVLSARVAHLYRPVAPTPPAAAASAEVVVVSHLHADHLHLPSLRRLGPRTRVVVPRGGAALVVRAVPALRSRVDEVGPGDVVQLGAVQIVATAAEHDGRRLPGSPHAGPALGYLLRHEGCTVWFAGDTGLFDEMSGIGPVDLALVPVGGWGPTLGQHHLDPDQAVEAVRRVDAAHAIPIHYGTFWPVGLRLVSRATYRAKCLQPGRRFADALEQASTARAHLVAPCTSVDVAVDR